ncbi:MAG: hypothetical protein HLUCCO07_01705 [Rhodobacteraceae bacterium HLUCCO07]|nr:MAG: hypothetical protein HLUCCO07_01705 [Rhodobacteraceae bacterium HLUCCO07]
MKQKCHEPDLEDDLAELHALSFAIETCADVCIGLLSPDTAREALPTLVRLQQDTIERVRDRIERLGKVS